MSIRLQITFFLVLKWKRERERLTTAGLSRNLTPLVTDEEKILGIPADDQRLARVVGESGLIRTYR